MPNRSTDPLFQLIKSLEKSEKRNFKLYATRNSSSDELKSVQLFDALDKMDLYDEAILLKKNESIKKQQLSNLKAHLYKQILSSLRLINVESIDIALHEQMDYARILYNKGLYHQSLKVLDKLKEQAKIHNQFTYLQQVLFFEKKIEALYITRSMQDRADHLSKESDEVSDSLALVSQLSNLSLQLYSWYIKNGHSRNEEETQQVQEFFISRLGDKTAACTSFYQRLYLYQSFCWNAFIRQDFLQYYRYTQKWVNLFEEEPFMLEIETGHYIKGMHNLMGSHFDLGNHKKLAETLKTFDEFCESDLVKNNVNNRIQCFVYSTISHFNKHFLEGSFTEGLALIPDIEEKIKEYEIYLDRHRVLVFYYKIACLYFGSGNYEKAIDYLNKIINWKVDLRTDLQCYSRLLHLIAHYELGNEDILDHLIKSVYRFMAKMHNLSVVEEEIFKFIRTSFHVTVRDIKPELQKLLVKLKALQNNRFETRAFIYLDIISWLESKLDNIPVQDVLKRKFAGKVKRFSELSLSTNKNESNTEELSNATFNL
jgi:tetratricopeptide (TPR) repeat protein